MNENLKIVGSTWFTELGSDRPIGIVAVKDTVTLEVKFYIGTGLGEDQRSDEEDIATTGAKFFAEDVNGFITDSLIRSQGTPRVDKVVEAE